MPDIRPALARGFVVPSLLLTVVFAAPPESTSREEEVPPPLQWVAPSGFDPRAADLGLPHLPGLKHEVIYAPLRSTGSVEDGGPGNYESVLHGTFNHHTKVVVVGNKVVVYWTNHTVDENGPGQRILARWGILNEARDQIDWGDPGKRTVELVPAPVPVRRRLPFDREGVDRRYVVVSLTAVDGLLRLGIVTRLSHGWTDDMRYRSPKGQTIPDERFRVNIDKQYHFDIFWDLNARFFQVWGFVGDELTSLSPLYVERQPASELRMTETLTFPMPPLEAHFARATPIAEAPPVLAELFTQTPAVAGRNGRYLPHTEHLATNGKNALWHWAEFLRADHTPVMLHDNRDDLGHYYAAVADKDGVYSAGIRTNLHGYGMPAAGRLPDGRSWIVGNSRGRFGFFLTLSDDGKRFDRSWFLLHVDQKWTPGFAKPERSGPQYPHAAIIGEAIWIFYSIGKEQIGATRIPFASLPKNTAGNNL